MRKGLMLKLLVGLSLSAVVGAAFTGPAAGAKESAGAREAAGASHRGILPPRNPAASLWPAPSFLASCSQGDDGSPCNSLVLAALSHARQTLEKLGGMSFSLAGYEKLTPAEQLFVTVDLERTARGLPPALVLSRSLDAIAQAGAQAGRDPAIGDVRPLPGGGRPAYQGATWAGGWINPLGSDYGWMYDDGPGSTNQDCRSDGSGLCWGHRDIILVAFGSGSCGGGASELAMGAGHATTAAGYGESDTEVLVGVCGPAPTDAVFTWTEAKKLLDIGA
jgi:hypothetical protein